MLTGVNTTLVAHDNKQRGHHLPGSVPFHTEYHGMVIINSIKLVTRFISGRKNILTDMYQL